MVVMHDQPGVHQRRSGRTGRIWKARRGDGLTGRQLEGRNCDDSKAGMVNVSGRGVMESGGEGDG